MSGGADWGEVALKVTGNPATGEVALVLVAAGGEQMRLPLAPTDALAIAEGLRQAVATCCPEPVAVATHAGSAARN